MSADEGRPGILAIVKRRRFLLALVVVVSVLAALPFALSVPAQYQSSAQVLIPASDPVSMGTNDVSRVSLQLAAYATAGLPQDVSRSVGDRAASGLRSVTAVQLRDQDLWLVTALADSPATAQQSVTVAVQSLITHSNDLAETMVRSLESNVAPSLAQLNRTISMLSSRILQIQQRERALSRKIVHLRQSGTPGRVPAVRTKLQALRDRRLADAATLDLAKGKRDAYPGMVQTAFTTLQERIAASAVISPPPPGKRSAPVGLVATIGLAVLAGLVVGLLLVLLIERRSYRRARVRDASLSPVAPREMHESPEPERADVVSSLESTKRGGGW